MTVIDQPSDGIVLDAKRPMDVPDLYILEHAATLIVPTFDGPRFLVPERVLEVDSTVDPALLVPVTEAWLDPRPTRIPELPVSLRTVACHGAQRKKQYIRRQSPKIRLSLLVVLFVAIYILFSNIVSYQHSPLNYFLSVV
jgi:hypothetical protein